MIDHSTAVRPTRLRLQVAMAISVCIIATLLPLSDSLLRFDAGAPILSESILSVSIIKKEAQPTQQRDARPLQLIEVTFREYVAPVVPEYSISKPPATEWHVIAKDVVRTSGDQQFLQEQLRDTKWRQTRSTMFQPAAVTVISEEQPIIEQLPFVYRSRIVGLGLNIGSCFIGLPVAGVPVEKRQAAITLFVCG